MVEKSLVEDENWTDGDTVTAAELNNHAAEHNAMYDGAAGEVVADVNNGSLVTEQTNITPTVVAAADSPYTTQGESRLAVDTTNGAVTVTLASADAVDGRLVKIVDHGLNAGTNPITVEVEGANGEVINPGGAASKTIALTGGSLEVENVGGNWYSGRNAEREAFATDTLAVGGQDSDDHWEEVFNATYTDETPDETVTLPDYVGAQEGSVRITGRIGDPGPDAAGRPDVLVRVDGVSTTGVYNGLTIDGNGSISTFSRTEFPAVVDSRRAAFWMTLNIPRFRPACPGGGGGDADGSYEYMIRGGLSEVTDLNTVRIWFTDQTGAAELTVEATRRFTI